MNNAAAMAVFGLPAYRYLTTDDPEERMILYAVARRADALIDAMQRNLAAHIVNNYVRVRRRG